MKNFIVIVLVILLTTSCVYNDIKKYKAKTTAVVVDYGSARSGYFLIYKYKVDGKEYEGSHGAIFSKKCIEHFIGKQFILFYSSKNPENSMMLVCKSNYTHWNMPFPDSLKWVENCF